MFRIECFVDDKNLPKVMHALSGISYDLKVQSVVNAAPVTKAGKVEPLSSAKTQPERIYNRLVLMGKDSGQRIVVADIKAAMELEKIPDGSFGTIRNKMVEAGQLKMISRGQYSFHVKH